MQYLLYTLCMTKKKKMKVKKTLGQKRVMEGKGVLVAMQDVARLNKPEIYCFESAASAKAFMKDVDKTYPGQFEFCTARLKKRGLK